MSRSRTIVPSRSAQRSSGRISARTKILRAAMALEDHRSVNELTVDEIAASAQVAKGSVYYHFGSKEQLVQEMLLYGASELMTIIGEAVEESEQYQGVDGLREQYRGQVAASFNFLNAFPSFTGLVAFAMARRQAEESEQLREGKEAIVSLITNRLEHLDLRAVEVGLRSTATSRTALEIAATGLLSAAVTLSIERHTSHPEWTIQECIDALVNMSVPLPAAQGEVQTDDDFRRC